MRLSKILVFIVFLMISFESYAINVSSTGTAKIKDGRLREAYYRAMENSVIGAVKWYYRQNKIKGIDVTGDFMRFVNGYSILDTSLSDDNTTVSIRMRLNLDEKALKDANLIVNQHTDPVVYIFRGIDNNIIPANNIKKIIESQLTSNQFSLAEQSNFLVGMRGKFDNESIEKSFKDLEETDNLFIFDFQPVYDKEMFVTQFNTCELVTTISVYGKKGEPKKLQIVTGDDLKSDYSCYVSSINQAAISIMSYIRENMIKLPENAARLSKYRINLLNLNNMVTAKNIINLLIQRGVIKNYKTLSYSQKIMAFEVETFFKPDNLLRKIQGLEIENEPVITDSGSAINIDFSKQPAISDNVSE